MKKINYIASFCLLFLLVSCSDDFLEPVPTSAISGASFFSTEAQLETAVVNMYDGIQGVNALELTSSNLNHAVQVEFYLTEMRSDNTRTKSSEGEAAQFESYTIESTNGIVDDYYRSFYNVIFRANTVLENLGVASEETAMAFEAEAKFVRAYAHFNLVRLFGDIPMVDKIVRVSESDVQYVRVAKETIYDFIISDLQTAIDGLDNSSVNRASKAAAQALLAKVYLTTGDNYTEAQVLCESIMGGSYALETDFKDVFYNESNSEVIFSVGYAPDNVNDSQNFSAEWLNAVGRTAGVNYVTTEARMALDEMGGNRTPLSYRQDALQPTQYQVVKYLPNGDESLDIDATSNDPTSAGNDWIVIRYADVLLMHVEAILAGGQTTSVSAALNSFQQVRNRAGLTDAVSSITKQMLLDERRVELAFENHRFYDLVRFGVAQDVLSEFSSANGYSFSGTDLLLPIPQREINLSNGLLNQNPGY